MIAGAMTIHKKKQDWGSDEVVMTASIDKQCVHKMRTVINEIPSLVPQVIYHQKKNDKKVLLSWMLRELFGIIFELWVIFMT